jgi:hypothetical protein
VTPTGAADDARMRRWACVLISATLGAAACGGGQTTQSPTPTVSPIATATAPATATPGIATRIDHGVVYFARDRLPPVAVHVPGVGMGATAEARIKSRLDALFTTAAPNGLVNVALRSSAVPGAVRIDGDLATVDFSVPDGMWDVHGSAGTLTFIQQVIFTATEEPGIRRVLITENGHEALVGEGVIIDHPSSRENVAGYVAASADPVTWRTEPRLAPIAVVSRVSVEMYAPGLARFIIDTGLRGEDAKADLGFTASVTANDERVYANLGKWALTISIPGATSDEPSLRVVDQTPVRAIQTMVTRAGVRYDIGLDDLRPWRAAMLYEPLRLVVDFGGDPAAVSSNIALYRPAFGASVGPRAVLSGMIRAFEAQFEYRIHDATGRVIDGYARGSIGTAELWGTFDVELPALPVGATSLEIILRSPKDGSISETVFTSFEYGP